MKRFIVLISLVAGCGGDDDGLELEDRDPRCVSACPATMQAIEGVGEICSSASRAQCLDECEVRIAGLASTCQTCLLEDACFDPNGGGDGNSCGGDDDAPWFCDSDGMATITGWNGSCSFACEDSKAHTNCLKQVMPTKEVACTAEWRPVTECSQLCGG